MALSPTAFMRSDETSLSLSIASVLVFAMAPYLPDPLRERELRLLRRPTRGRLLGGGLLRGGLLGCRGLLGGGLLGCRGLLGGGGRLLGRCLLGRLLRRCLLGGGPSGLGVFEAERFVVRPADEARLRGRRFGSGSSSGSRRPRPRAPPPPPRPPAPRTRPALPLRSSPSSYSSSGSSSPSSPSSYSSSGSSSPGPAVSDLVTASRREVAVVRAAALAASSSLPDTWSWSFLSSGFFSASLAPCASSACGLVLSALACQHAPDGDGEPQLLGASQQVSAGHSHGDLGCCRHAPSIPETPRRARGWTVLPCHGRTRGLVSQTRYA